MEVRRRFRFLRRLIRYFRRRQAKLRAKRSQYARLPNKRDVELWKERDELMPADYTDHRWRAQGRHHERRRGKRGDGDGGDPPRHPVSPDAEAKYGSPRTRGSMRHQREEAGMHPGHHAGCACLVVKQYTQEMHKKAREERARQSHGPHHQVPMDTSFGELAQERHGHPHKMFSHPDYPEPQVLVPIQANNPWLAAGADQASTHKHEGKRLSSKLADTVMKAAEITARMKHHAKALSSQPYQDLNSHHHETGTHVHSASGGGECAPNCACASVREFTRQMNQKQQLERQEQHMGQPTFVASPSAMPMHSTNPFIESTKSVVELAGTGVRKAGDAAMAGIQHGAELAERQKLHFQSGPNYNRFGVDEMEHCAHQYDPVVPTLPHASPFLHSGHHHPVMPTTLPIPSTSPFIHGAQQTADQMKRGASAIVQTVSSAVQHGAEISSRAKHHMSDTQGYGRLPSETAADFLDSSDPRGRLWSEELDDFIDSSDTSANMGSDTIDNFLDGVDESTFHELKDLDQSSLCELQDLCVQLQTIIEEESEGEDGAKADNGDRAATRARTASSSLPGHHVKIPVAIVSPQAVIPSPHSPDTQPTKSLKGSAQKPVKATQCAHESAEPQLHGRMAIDFPMPPVENDATGRNDRTVERHSRHSGSAGTRSGHGDVDAEHLTENHRDTTDRRHAHEHGENCACQVVRRYTREMERRDRNRRASRESEDEATFGVPQVNIPVSPNNPYIAEANARALGEGSGVRGTVGKVVEKVRQGTEAASRIGVYVKGKMQYDKLNSFEDDFNQMAINEIVKQDRQRMQQERRRQEMKRSASLPEPTQLQAADYPGQRQFMAPTNWVQFHEGESLIGRGAAHARQVINDGVHRGKEAIQRLKVHHQGGGSYTQLRHSEGDATPVKGGQGAERRDRPMSEPTPQVVVDPSTGIRIYKAHKKHRRRSQGDQDVAQSGNAYGGGSPQELAHQTHDRNSLPADFVIHQQPQPQQYTASSSTMYTTAPVASKSHIQVTADVHHSSILRQKQDAPPSRITEQHAAYTNSNQHAARHTMPAMVDSEKVELTEQERRAQSFHEDPRARARKTQDIEQWVDSVAPYSSGSSGEKRKGETQTAGTEELWPRDYHETNENQLNEMSRHRTLTSKKPKKKKRKLNRKAAGLQWVQYQSLVDLSEGAPVYDDEWEDELEMKKARKKAKRKALRKKTAKRIRKGLKVLVDGMSEVNESGVYFPSLYYNNQSPRHRPRN